MENIFAIERDKGRAEGKNEGIIENLIHNLKSLMSKHHTFEESCNLLDVDKETREKLLDTGEFSLSQLNKE